MKTPKIDLSNTTVIPLDADGEWIGEWQDVSEYETVTISVKADVTGTMYMEFTNNNNNSSADSSLPYDISAGINEVHTLKRTRQFYRSRYVNDSAAQTSFQVSTFFENGGLLVAPLNLTLGQDADALAVRSVPVEFDIAQGKKGGVSKSNKLGKNSDIDTTVSLSSPEFVTEIGGTYTGFPVSDAETITITSDNTADAAAGTGARTLTIIGLDSDWNQISETVTLNGTTGVTTANVFRRAHTMFVRTAGSTGTNVGVLTATHTTTTANVFLSILAGVGSSNFAVQTVPAGKVGYIFKYTGAVRRGGTTAADGAFWIRPFEGAFRYRRPFTINAGAQLEITPYGGFRVGGEKTDVAMVITATTQNNTVVTAGFDLIFIDV